MDSAFAKKILPQSVWTYIIGWLVALFLFVSFNMISGQEAPNIVVYILGMIDLGIHEISHVVAIAGPEPLEVAAGTLGELLFAAALVLAAYKTKAYFGYVFVAQWFMMVFLHTGQYMADARAHMLALVSFSGGQGEHDWTYLFGHMGQLNNDVTIGAATSHIGVVYGVVGLLIGLWFIVIKIFKKKIRY